MIQSSRRQARAYGLTDSPVGQLAWIAEKFKEWTDSAAYPEDAVDRDHLLTNLSLYWFTRTANSSARLYYETVHSAASRAQVEPSNVPTGVAGFPREIAPPIRRFAERSNNIVHWSEFDRGVTSRRWRSPTCWSMTCARSSAACVARVVDRDSVRVRRARWVA